MINRSALIVTTALALAAGSGAAQAADAAPRFDSSTVSGLGARNIGSANMSGRISALAGRAEINGKTTLLVGAASGGIWKSEDGGTTFRAVFNKPASQSIGAVAFDPKNPNTYWVGTGESWMRNSVGVGAGLYKTVDGGDNWTLMGLANSEHISKIIVDPTNSDVVYVCVPGKLWSDSAERGLYKTTDGGKTWALMLKGPNLSTGCSTLAMDPKDPSRLLVGMWDFRRTGWGFRSGGLNADAASGSAMMETRDGGRTWTGLDAANSPGLPKGPWGRLAISFAPSDDKVVYALIEGVRSALFRSGDGGHTWQERDRSQMMVWRPFYFANLIVDPLNPDRLFKGDLSLIASDDGGKGFSNVGQSIHADDHDLWIDPTDTKHLVVGNDGGLWTSHDGGNRWWKSDNLPVSQFYHVSVDDKDPYQVYGGLQDNSAWVGDSAYPGGITNAQWENLGGGDGFWAWPDPADEGFAYVESQGGAIARVNRHTLEARDIQPRSDTGEKLRFNWNTPVAVSPNEKGAIYIGAQYLFRSRDHGQSWDKISPDLTTNDPSRQKQEESGGITVDNSAAETYTTITTVSESPKAPGQIWVGTDDGNVQLTRDGGHSWTNATKNIKGLPANSWVSEIQASRFDPAVAYVAFDRHTFGDMDPYAYKTSDYGHTWRRIASPDGGVRGYAHAILQDTVDPNLLFMGTEFGLWISTDDGGHWAAFKGNDFPTVAVRGLAIQPRDSDLVIATHGRGMWIIDDITPLRGLTPQTMKQEIAFLPQRPIQQRIQGNGGWVEGDAKFTGDNPASGAVITYYEPHRHIFGKLKIEVLDAHGAVVDTLSASKHPGINRVTWSMRAPAPQVPPAAQVAFSASQGPRLVPGDYQVRITSNGQTYTQPLVVTMDRRASYTLQDRQAQFDASQRVSGIFDRMTGLVAAINAVRVRAEEGAKAAGPGSLGQQLQALSAHADTLRKDIVATKEGGAITGEERLREWTDQLYGAINSWDGRPSVYQVQRIGVLDGLLSGVQKRFDALRDGELASANQALGKAGKPPIVLPRREAAVASIGGGDVHALAGWSFALRPTAFPQSDVGEAERD